jgi:hypothetical protein
MFVFVMPIVASAPERAKRVVWKDKINLFHVLHKRGGQ